MHENVFFPFYFARVKYPGWPFIWSKLVSALFECILLILCEKWFLFKFVLFELEREFSTDIMKL